MTILLSKPPQIYIQKSLYLMPVSRTRLLCWYLIFTPTTIWLSRLFIVPLTSQPLKLNSLKLNAGLIKLLVSQTSTAFLSSQTHYMQPNKFLTHHHIHIKSSLLQSSTNSGNSSRKILTITLNSGTVLVIKTGHYTD